MALFNKIPGFVRSPPGLERTVLRYLPSVFPAGLALLLTPSVGLRVAEQLDRDLRILVALERLELAALSLILPFCNVLVLAAVGAFTVMVMKGPAYVADPYPLKEAEGE